MPEMVLPLFPLPDVVHFPATRLPLHIFEPRYREMVAELLGRPAAERRVGMILAAADPATGAAQLYEPGCAGRLVEHEPLGDGRSNIVLEGEFRFEVERLLEGRPFRRALVRPLADLVPAAEHERAERLESELARLTAAVAAAAGSAFPLDLEALAGLGRPGSLVTLANRLAAGLDLPALRKQTLLAEPPLERAEQVAGILRSRLKVLSFLSPFRHLAGTARSN
jgi:Lon protease-like protein